MKLNPMDLGVCGIEQFLCAGTVSFNTEGVANGAVIAELPADIIITKAVAVVETAFNASTTNVLTIGTNEAADDLLNADAITEGTAGTYMKDMFKIMKKTPVKIKAKFTGTGTAATAGKADIYIGVVSIPE